MRNHFLTRTQAVEAYLKGSTLKDTASQFKVHPITLWTWVKWYRKGGQENLRRSYYKSWNRVPRETEERVMFLKETNPSLTVRKTREILEEENIHVSDNGIHNIWRRYNLVRRPTEEMFSPYGPLTRETETAVEHVRRLLEKNKDASAIRKAARVLNNLPSYPVGSEEILQEIPEKLLSPRRRLDRLYNQFLKIPTPEYLKKIRVIRRSLEKKGYLYSSLVAGFLEMEVLHWIHSPEEELKLSELLEERKGGLHDLVLNFGLTFFRARAYTVLLQITKAKECAKVCKRLLRSLSNPKFYMMYGDLMSSMGEYKEGVKFFQQALAKKPDQYTRKSSVARIALCSSMLGEYKKALEIYTAELSPEEENYEMFISFIKAFLSFSLGKLEKSTLYLHKILEKSEKEQYRNYIFATSSGLAAIKRALGQEKDSEEALKKYLPLMKKYKLKRETRLIELQLGDYAIDEDLGKLPPFRLLHLLQKADKSLKEKDYRRALSFAKRKGIIGILHRLIVFFPGSVRRLLKYGKDTGLPKAILKLPVFNKESPVFCIKFLGDLTVHKNEKCLKNTLPPKDAAFITHLALKAGEPSKKILLEDLYNNFWKDSPNQAQNLSHLLVRIKKALKIPTHLIEISYKGESPALINQGIYFITDYGEWVQILITAQALNRAGEKCFAKREFLRAINLLRGEPFKKMYDNWSETMRAVIINRLETEVAQFTESCMQYKTTVDAKRVLEKAARIIPHSQIIQELTNRLAD